MLKIINNTLHYFCCIVVFCWGLMACSQSLNTHNNDGLTTINLCESDLFAPTTAKELFDSIKCVALETTDECLIATVTKIIVDEERIYIYDGYANAVYAFDKAGRYIGKIHSKGRAYNEYIALYDVALTKTKELYLLCQDAQTIKIFGRDFSHQRNITLDFQIDALEQIDDSLFAFNGSGENDRFIVYDVKNNSKLYSTFPYSEFNSIRKLQPIVKCGNIVCMQQNEYNSSLFEVRRDGVYGRWYINFDGHNMTREDFVRTEWGLVASPHCMNIGWFAENEKYLHFQMQCESVSENPFFVFYSKDSQTIKSISENTYTDDIMHYPYLPIMRQGDGDNCFIGIVNPHLISNDDLYAIGLNNVCAEDNPIVVFYYMKKF